MYNNSRRIDILKSYDPRTKLHIALMFVVATLFSWKLIPVLVTIIMAFILILLCRTGIKALVSNCISVLLLSIILGIIFMIILPINIGLYIMLKLISLSLVYVALEKNIKQGEVIDGLALGFGLRAKTTRRLFSFLDFPSKVIREKRRARKAQIARGVDPGGTLFSRFHKEMLLALPNLNAAMSRTRKQNRSMDKRQYSSTRRRNVFVPLRLQMTDKVISIIFMIFMLASLISNILL
ncbi:MAG: energy-coupling factor transporter transmembrane protein EcfT [Eubacterium sp.]|nr:energy-coupling factor transporter transmembrane protein EcfT [Eubacterium sp.]